MRTPTLAALGSVLALSLTACASGPPAGTRVIDLERLDEVVLDNKGPYVLRIPEGTRLPVRVNLDTPFVHTEDSAPPVLVVFDRTVFWYPRRADEISFDGTTWQDLDDGHEGGLSIGIGKSSVEGVVGSVGITLRAAD